MFPDFRNENIQLSFIKSITSNLSSRTISLLNFTRWPFRSRLSIFSFQRNWMLFTVFQDWNAKCVWRVEFCGGIVLLWAIVVSWYHNTWSHVIYIFKWCHILWPHQISYSIHPEFQAYIIYYTTIESLHQIPYPLISKILHWKDSGSLHLAFWPIFCSEAYLILKLYVSWKSIDLVLIWTRLPWVWRRSHCPEATACVGITLLGSTFKFACNWIQQNGDCVETKNSITVSRRLAN